MLAITSDIVKENLIMRMRKNYIQMMRPDGQPSEVRVQYESVRDETTGEMYKALNVDYVRTLQSRGFKFLSEMKKEAKEDEPEKKSFKRGK